MKFVLFMFIVIFHLAYCQDDTTAEIINSGPANEESSSVSSPGITIIEESTSTEPVTEPPTTVSSNTESSITEYPITESPTTETAATELSTTEPPITEPPVTEPPVTEPSVTEPPVTEPPVTAPPVTEPPVTEPTTTKPFTTGPTTTATPILVLNDINQALSWSPTSTQAVIIEVDEGFKIAVNITECNISGENGEYAIIGTDENINNGLLFTYGVSRRPAYLYNNNRLYLTFFGTDASNFTAVFTRMGEGVVVTTTEEPTTTIVLPSPGYNDSTTLLVYLSGRSIDDFFDLSLGYYQELKNSIARMAAEYCLSRNFSLNGTVTSNNVVVYSLTNCPILWPDSETCVQINFSVPVNLVEDPEYGFRYELTTQSLKEMWDEYSGTFLPEGVTTYYPPENHWLLILGAFLGGTLVFGLILIIIRHYMIKLSKKVSRRKLSDAVSIVSESDRNSQVFLDPHYLQDTPALFENAYPMYNPDKNVEYSDPSYASTFQYDDYQDITVESRENEESGA